MNEIKNFESDEFGKVRVVVNEDKPYFVASDVTKALGYANRQKAVRDHCKHAVTIGVNIGLNDSFTLEIDPQTKIINFEDIRRLVSRSKMPNAEKFQDWLTAEVMPLWNKNKRGAKMKKYWKTETPVEVDTGKNVLCYFNSAGKLQISLPNWKDDNGQVLRGKTVTLDINALKDNPIVFGIIKQIAQS
jgi:prophage antirepressor-like protein